MSCHVKARRKLASQLHQPSRELLVLTLLKWDTLGPDMDPSLSRPVVTGAVVAAAAGALSARVASRGGRGSEANCRGDNPGPGVGFQSGAADVRQRIPIGFHPGGEVPVQTTQQFSIQSHTSLV